ncbi:SH3 domain-containing protein [Bacillus salipaludis]|uniref:SH3 domain-containing protein n=1 Tax=Bacillus salipaludis TaxID=2547811 RepID=UPI002E1F2432|nr:SH3 domain-containing protein [Bacillus salipaludis]
MKKIGKIAFISTSLLFAEAVAPLTHYDFKMAEASTLKLVNVVYQTTANLNLRPDPGTKNKAILVIPKGKSVTAIEQSGKWFKVKYSYTKKGKIETKTGWVSGSYLKKISAVKPPAPSSLTSVKITKTTYQTTANLNIRSGPGTKYKVLVAIPKGKTITSAEKTGNWYKVVYSYGSKGKSKTVVGWVSGTYLKEYYYYSSTSGTYYIANTSVNLYPSPDKKNKPVQSFKQGVMLYSNKQVVNSIGQKWYQVSYKGKTLYVYNGDVTKYIKSKEYHMDEQTDYLIMTNTTLRKFSHYYSDILTTIPKNTKVTPAYKTDNGWYKITYNGKVGYVPNSNLQEFKNESTEPDNTGKMEHPIVNETYMASEDINFRTDSNLEASVLTTIPKGTIMIPTSKTDDNWYKLSYQGKEGYVSGKFIQQVTTGDPMGSRDSYQFIDLRTQSPVTANQINQYIANYVNLTGKYSILTGKGNVFIEVGKRYGINALYLAAHAIHESAFGTSTISISKNNLFGFGAYDAAPFISAYHFDSVDSCIEYIAREMKTTYLNPNSWKYHGAYLGFSTKTLSNQRIDTASEGMNFYYASDPKWGKAIAQHMEKILHYQKSYYDRAAVNTVIPSRPTIPNGSDLFPDHVIAIAKTDLVLNSKKGVADKIKTIPKGSTFIILEKTNDFWVRVKVDNREYWTSDVKFSSYKDFLSVQNLGRVTVSGLNVRTGPSRNYPSIAQLSLNDYVQIVLKKDRTLSMNSDKTWYEVILMDGTHGWASKTYITKELN